MKRKTTMTKLKNFFKEKEEEGTVIPEEERKGYLDPTNVLMFVPKTTTAKEILTSNYEVGEEQKVPDLNYYDKEGSHLKSSYSNEFLKKVLEFMTVFDDEKTTLQLNNDYPLWVENSHFIVIIAPRVDKD